MTIEALRPADERLIVPPTETYTQAASSIVWALRNFEP